MTIERLEAAVAYLQQREARTQEQPNPRQVVEALVQAEKQARQSRLSFAYEQLLGTWRLGFVSGTQTVRPGATPLKRPGAGRFLPGWVKVTIRWGDRSDVLPQPVVEPSAHDAASEVHSATAPLPPSTLLGSVTNTVCIGPFVLQLTGPTRWWPQTRSLAFDFTHLRIHVGAWKVFDGDFRGGQASHTAFGQQSLPQQAFFTFFRVEPCSIAARGKGGGLALWIKSE